MYILRIATIIFFHPFTVLHIILVIFCILPHSKIKLKLNPLDGDVIIYLSYKNNLPWSTWHLLDSEIIKTIK